MVMWYFVLSPKSQVPVSRVRSENNLDLHHCGHGCHCYQFQCQVGLTYRGLLTNYCQFSLSKVEGTSDVDSHHVFKSCFYTWSLVPFGIIYVA